MGAEKNILTDEAIDKKLEELAPRYLAYVDPMKMAQWTLERCCQMVDEAISTKTIDRAISSGELEAFKVGRNVTVEPAKFLTWYRRHRK